MSEYVNIEIRNLSLFCFRNYLKSEIVELFFSKKDLLIVDNYISDPNDEDSVPYTRYVYKTSVKKARERLDAMGYTLGSFKKLFNEQMIEAIDYYPFLSHLHICLEDIDDKAQERIKKNVTFKKWVNSTKRIIKHELEFGNINYFKEKNQFEAKTECDKVIYYALLDQDSESFYAIMPETIKIAYVVRLILECCLDEDEIILDFSNIENWSDDCIPKALKATDDVEKTIILVEGTSDKDILEFALERLYPHLVDLFYFMDFADECGNKRAGSASEIRKHIKTFYYSKLRTKFIAIFDNDAEGYQEKNLLLNDKKIKKWPNNFRILIYPEIKNFRKYPTLASNGSIIIDDINRKACSVELYLPDEIIMSDGVYLPIEWESRKTIKKSDGTVEYLYQGVILNKERIKKSFLRIKNEIERGKKAFVPKEWERMKSLLEEIVFAFR